MAAMLAGWLWGNCCGTCEVVRPHAEHFALFACASSVVYICKSLGKAFICMIAGVHGWPAFPGHYGIGGSLRRNLEREGIQTTQYARDTCKSVQCALEAAFLLLATTLAVHPLPAPGSKLSRELMKSKLTQWMNKPLDETGLRYLGHTPQ